MVFGIFTRKPNPPPTSDPPVQLRTPSPSVVDSSSARVDDLCPPITPSPPPDNVTDPTALRALIQSIPPKIVHSYILAHLATASPQSLTYLTAFFSALVPPPKLHCVRCHKGYFDVENDDRSCLIGHDDESAEVERVGKGAGYETLWGCCGKTVDGDGDMGPPDGWCYEGMHTTDTKRARFRADSTIHDDKLTSCVRLRCHDPVSSTTRKRSRRAVDADSEDSELDDEDTSSSQSSVRTRSRTSKKARTGPDPASDVDDEMDIAESSSLKHTPKSPRAKPVSSAARTKPKAKSRVKTQAFSSDSPSPSKKPGSRFAAGATPLAAAGSFTSTSNTHTASATSVTNTTTLNVAFAPVATPPAAKIKSAMQPKSKPKPKQPKRLNEVVQSSIAGEIA
ncbi:hypothetical protein B0H10DRAFT_2216605 [Mycena sp. CBHHK59/15]|nr:hypothetical protein B0H10DRAFT_2216605 [Mycena sp. CBHHK59/15]